MSFKIVEPCAHKVVVKLLSEEQKSKGGIIMGSTTNKYHSVKAQVMQLGPTAFKDFGDGKPWCKVGDFVLIARYAGENYDDIITAEEENVGKDIYQIVNDADILAILEEVKDEK